MLSDDELEDIIFSEYPARVSMEKIIGKDHFEELTKQRGGRRIYIPETGERSTILSLIITNKQVERLSSVYGGIYYFVPVYEEKKDRVRLYLSEGYDANKIAEMVGCTVRYVFFVKNAILNEQPDNQADLF